MPTSRSDGRDGLDAEGWLVDEEARARKEDEVGSRALMQSTMWASRAVSSPSGPLGGNGRRQTGQMSLSRRRGREIRGSGWV